MYYNSSILRGIKAYENVSPTMYSKEPHPIPSSSTHHVSIQQKKGSDAKNGHYARTQPR